MATTNSNPMDALDKSAVDMQNKALRECEAMIAYAQANGKKINPAITQKLKKLQMGNRAARNTGSEMPLMFDDIGDIHNMLAETIAPASPATVVLMEETKKSGFFRLLGPVPLVGKMMFVTLLCLFVFVGLFVFDEVDGQTINGDILSYPAEKFILNESFIIAAAALGSAFYGLFEAYKYISISAYDPKYDSIYWIRFVLGIVAGVILAQFIFVGAGVPPVDPNALTGTSMPDATGTSMMTYKPLLAFLGGFSCRVVHKILHSLVDSVETFVSGSAKDAIRAREEMANAQIKDKVNAIQQENGRKEAANRIEAAMKLMKLQEKMGEGADNEYIKQQLKNLINDMVKPIGGDDHNQANNNGGGGNNDNTFTNPTTDTNAGTGEFIAPNVPEEFIGDLPQSGEENSNPGKDEFKA